MAGNYLVSLPERNVYTEDVYKLSTLHERICFMYKHMLYTDVTLLVKGNGNAFIHPIPAHKAILSVGSPVFADMFQKSNEPEIEIGSVDESAIKKVIEFLYTDEVEFENEFDIIQTYIAADMFRVTNLKEECERLLSTIPLSVDSVCETLKLSTTLKAVNFADRVKKFIEENAMLVFKTPAFSVADKKMIKTIIAFPSLSVHSEKDIFNAVMAWAAKQSPENAQRKQWSEVRALVDSLLHHIRFLTMSSAEFAECISRFPGFFTEKESLDIMMHISKPGSSDLPTWCNKCRVKRSKAQPKASPVCDKEFINITLRLIEQKKFEFPPLDFLCSTIEVSCKKNSYILIGAKLRWKRQISEVCSVGTLRYSVKVFVLPSGYEHVEPIRTIFGEQEASIQFCKAIIIKKNEKLMIEVTVDNIRGFHFFTCEKPVGEDQCDMPLSYTLSCAPKQYNFSVFDSISFRKANYPSKASKTVRKKKTGMNVQCKLSAQN